MNNSMDFEFKNLDPGIYSIHVSGKYSFDVDINENNHQTSDFSILFIRVLPEAEIDLGAISITRKSSLIHGSKPDANEIQHYKDLGDRYRALKKSIQAANIQIYTNSKAYHGMYKNIFFSKQPSFFPLVEESAVHSLIPGFGQFYNKRQLRGKIYLSSEMTSLAGFIVFRLLENKYTDQYGKTTDMHDLILSTTYSKAVFFNAAANISLGAIYGIYLTSVLDAVIDSYWTRKKIKSSIDITQKDHSLEMGIHISSVF